MAEDELTVKTQTSPKDSFTEKISPGGRVQHVSGTRPETGVSRVATDASKTPDKPKGLIERLLGPRD